MYQFEQLSDLQIPLVNKFYKSARYSSKAGRGEVIFVLKGAQGIVAAVRLQPKAQGWYFLRAMCVAPELRGQGVGHQLLDGMAEFFQVNRVYCYPFDHLEGFYAYAGFRLCVPEESAEFMSEAFYRYTQQGRKICLMTRERQ